MSAIQLIPIEGVGGVAHEVRALCIDGKAPALEALEKWRRSSPGDHKQIMATMRMVANLKRLRGSSRVSKDTTKGSCLYEMKGGRGRVFFFYTDDDEVVVCLSEYWKTDSSPKKQAKAFARARKLYERFEAETGRRWTL